MLFRLPFKERSDAAPRGVKGKLSAKRTDEVKRWGIQPKEHLIRHPMGVPLRSSALRHLPLGTLRVFRCAQGEGFDTLHEEAIL